MRGEEGGGCGEVVGDEEGRYMGWWGRRGKRRGGGVGGGEAREGGG